MKGEKVVAKRRGGEGEAKKVLVLRGAHRRLPKGWMREEKME